MPKTLTQVLNDKAHSRALFRQGSVQTPHRRTAAALFLNIEHLETVYGTNRLATACVTFRDDPDPYTALRRMKKLERKFSKLFLAWHWVMEFTATKKVHFHFVLVCHHDIRTGLDVTAYDSLKAFSMQSRSEGRSLTPEEALLANALKRSLKANPALNALQKSFRKVLHSMKGEFGYHFDLTPIRTSVNRVAGYFQKNYLNAVRARHRTYPGVHLTGASRKCPKVQNSNFVLVTSRARFNYKAIGEALDMPDMSAMSERFGPRWSMALEPVIDELTWWMGNDPSRWPREAIREVVADHLGGGLN